MITEKDLYDILENKISDEAQKAFIRNNFQQHIAGRMCAAVDGMERVDDTTTNATGGRAGVSERIF